MDLSNPDFSRLVSRLRFRHFQLLVTLSREGSMRAAARQMHVTQPALSRMLEEIESMLGVKLFSRTSRGLVPTAQGHAATHGALQILEELWRVPQAVDVGTEGVTMIRVGAPHYVAHGFLPAVILRLRASRPRVQVVIVERPVPELFEALKNGDVDALITTYSPQHVEVVQVPLHQEKLYDEKYELIAGARHPLAGRRQRLKLADLVRQDWILPTQDSMLRKEIDWTFRRAGLLPPRPVVEANNPTTTLHLVAAGIGLAFAPFETLESAVAGSIEKIRVTPGIAASPVALIHRTGRMNERVEALRNALRI